MNSLPKISIIIPVYNVEAYIEECIMSVMQQTYAGEIECVVVDDCGNDQSIAIAVSLISKYKGPISFRILHHEHNRGLSASRNTGIMAASGDYLFFLDSDDFISEGCLTQLSNPLSNDYYDVVVGDYSGIAEELTVSPKLYIKHFRLSPVKARLALLNRQIYVMAWNKLINKEFLKKNNLYFDEGVIHEDEIHTFMMAFCNPIIYVTSAITYYYRSRPNSIMLFEKDSLMKVQAYQEVVLRITSHVFFDTSDPYCWDYVSLLIPNTLVGRLRHPVIFWKYYKKLRYQLSQQSSQPCAPGSASNHRKSIAMHWRLSVLGGYLWLMAREIKNILLS